MTELADTGRPSCPTCGAEVASDPTATYSVEMAAAHFCPAWRNPERNARLRRAIRRLWGRESASIYRCASCGFGFGWPHTGGDGEFYAILHERASYPSWRWEYGVAAQIMSEAFPAGGRVLDIGTGDGSFLLRLPPAWEKFGTESTDVQRKRLAARGIAVYSDLEEAADPDAGTFHAVTMFQVIEHVAEFRPMLACARRLLKEGGLLILSMPDGDVIPLRERATRCPDMPPNHINRWTAGSVALAMRKCGFESVLSRVEPPGWRSARDALALRVRADMFYDDASAGARVMRWKSRAARGAGLAAIGAATAVKMLPHLRTARLSMNFLAVGRAV